MHLVGLADLLHRTFPDPNSVLGLDRIREFLAANASSATRRFHVLVAADEDAGRVIGGSIFSYVASSNCGFSEYLVVDREVRGRGLGRQLFDRRKTVLEADAADRGNAACRGVFIEVDSPERTPADIQAAERASSIDVDTRLRVFGHLGFLRVDVPYVQPPLGEGKEPVEYLDLLFAPWDQPRQRVPSEWMLATLEVIWQAWSPGSAADRLTQLRQSVPGAEILLRDLSAK